ncbi:MAG: ABC transporter ATP-binding protein [Ignavibacteriales bacterium]|nr:ABC transporter ATP-binding protein [Ignavibacteriales bacterium]
MRKTKKTALPAIPAIAVQSITKTFRAKSSSPVRALDAVTFTVDKGEIVGLIGPNGAGKSTLLRILLGFMDPDSGNALLFNQHPESLMARKWIGYQGDSQFRSPTLNILTFLDLHATLQGLNGTAEHIENLLRQFNLHSASSFSLSALSKGMRQKLELVLAFLGSPKIVFLDEPTASLDPPSVFELRDFLEARKDSGTTVFFSSHNLTEVENVCDRVLFIKEGIIVAQYEMKKAKRGFLEKVFRKHLVKKAPA